MNILYHSNAVCGGVGLALTLAATTILGQQARHILFATAHRNPALVGPVIRLFGVGYFLLNGCNIIFTLGVGQPPTAAEDAVNYLCLKIGWIMYVLTTSYFGWVILILAGNHYWNRPKVEQTNA